MHSTLSRSNLYAGGAGLSPLISERSESRDGSVSVDDAVFHTEQEEPRLVRGSSDAEAEGQEAVVAAAAVAVVQGASGAPAAPRDGSKCRRYMFTLPNYSVTDRATIDDRVSAIAEYLCYQGEIAPTTGTPHLQGFVSFTNPRAFRAVKRLFANDSIHLDICRGTPEQCIAYCSKRESADERVPFVEYGTRPSGPGQGARSDLSEIGARLKSGATLKSVAQDFPGDFMRYSSGFIKFQALFQPSRNHKTKVMWFYGSTGTGKSMAARDRFPEAYWKSPNHQWWDGYDGVSDVVVDDYRCGFCPFNELLRLFDRYPLQLQVKGASVQFNARNIVITAPHRPEIMWSGRTGENLAQLLRRIDSIELFGEEPVMAPRVPGFEPGRPRPHTEEGSLF